MNSKILSVALIVAACLFATAVSASTPRDLNDLVGEKASHADPQIQRRGYVHIDTQRGGKNNSWGMWWSPSHRECATVAYEHGRVKAITSSPPADCNQDAYHTSYSDNDEDNAAGAALAIGAVALIAALSSSHKSHNHDDGQHYSDQDSEQEFERGYRDGLHNHHYDNFNGASSYSDGYNSGVEQRDHNTSYREHSGRNDRGYRQTVSYSDLEGARASSADNELENRGFRNVDGFKVASTSYTIWYNGSTSQCLQMTVADGKALDISEIGQHPTCR